MPKFMLLYRGEATDVATMSEEDQQAIMAKWGAWMEGVGPALADIGAPFGPAASVVDDGSSGTPAALTGYSIVEAADLVAATTLTDGHPYLSDNDGNYAVDVIELLPVPMQD